MWQHNMKNKNKNLSSKISILLLVELVAVLSLTSCSTMWDKIPGTRTVIVQKSVNPLENEPVPATVVGPWAEAMHQDVEVPGSIDPKGVYYRMPHKTIVEIRAEKYQRAQYPDPDGVYRERE